MLRFAPQICLLCLWMPKVYAQPAEGKAEFEVASVKPSDPNVRGRNGNTSQGLLRIRNFRLRDLVQRAYKVKDYQIAGGPNWADTAGFDIEAKEERGIEKLTDEARAARMRAELQSLLSERFQLVIHRETKTMTVYNLIAAKTGFKLQPVDNHGSSSTNQHNITLTATGVSMPQLADWLSDQVERPVLDATGIPGAFDFKLEWAPMIGPSSRDGDASSRASIFTSLQEQLGLKLESGRGPVEIIVIDHAEKPTDN